MPQPSPATSSSGARTSVAVRLQIASERLDRAAVLLAHVDVADAGLFECEADRLASAGDTRPIQQLVDVIFDLAALASWLGGHDD
jgi:hypothetical protein